MKRRALLLAAFAALLFFVGVYFWGPSKTPPTQKPLLTLATANFNDFEAAFGQAPDDQRLVLLLSPT
jgi:hypothetical protein